jgi:hypothetical protein
MRSAVSKRGAVDRRPGNGLVSTDGRLQVVKSGRKAFDLPDR